MAAKQPARIEYVDIDEVKRWPANPKLHDRARIVASLQRHGFVAPAVEDATSGKLVAGHGRLEALLWMRENGEAAPRRVVVKGKRWFMPVLRGRAFETEEEAEAYLLADNRASEIGGWEPASLAEILGSMGGVDLERLGWVRGDVDKLLAGPGEAGGGSSAGVDAGGFSAGAIRQMVFAFEGPQFDRLMRRLDPIMAKMKAKDHTELFLGLLEFHEKHPG